MAHCRRSGLSLAGIPSRRGFVHASPQPLWGAGTAAASFAALRHSRDSRGVVRRRAQTRAPLRARTQNRHRAPHTDSGRGLGAAIARPGGRLRRPARPRSANVDRLFFRRTGISARTPRDYDGIGLASPAGRAQSGYWQHSGTRQLLRVFQVAGLRSLGLSLTRYRPPRSPTFSPSAAALVEAFDHPRARSACPRNLTCTGRSAREPAIRLTGRTSCARSS